MCKPLQQVSGLVNRQGSAIVVGGLVAVLISIKMQIALPIVQSSLWLYDQPVRGFFQRRGLGAIWLPGHRQTKKRSRELGLNLGDVREMDGLIELSSAGTTTGSVRCQGYKDTRDLSLAATVRALNIVDLRCDNSVSAT